MNQTNGHHEKKRLTNPPQTIEFKIQRREKLGADSHWEVFEIPYRRNLNVISALMEIRKNPLTRFVAAWAVLWLALGGPLSP